MRTKDTFMRFPFARNTQPNESEHYNARVKDISISSIAL